MSEEIKASELRLGNLVDCDNKRYNENYIEIESIHFDRINVDFREYDINKLKPIPLTEKILLKCGFEKKEIKLTNSILYSLDEFEIYLYLDTNEFMCDMFIFEDSIKVEFVHTIQNLFFVLKQKELEIEL